MNHLRDIAFFGSLLRKISMFCRNTTIVVVAWVYKMMQYVNYMFKKNAELSLIELIGLSGKNFSELFRVL